jgi:lipopolysaccharide export system protein LptA
MKFDQLITLCWLLLCLPLTLHAANKNHDDKGTNYPITVNADQLVSQTKAGQSEYRGNVELSRNKLLLKGDKVKLHHPNDKLQEAIVLGSPATFKDFLPKKQQWMTGEAKQMIFDQEKDTLTLLQQAVMTMENGNSIRAEKIIIYNKDETFEAQGGKQSGRIKMVIQPDNDK